MALVSVVVPVYYNAESLPALLERLDCMASSQPEHRFEFVFVDDGSGDNSFAVLEGLARQDRRVHIIKLSRNFGSNPAILAGLSFARGDCTAVLSADLQDPPELLPEMIALWQAGNRVVLAARRQRADPLAARLFSAAFNRLFRRFVFPDFPPNGFDFMLLDRRVVDILAELKEKNSYLFGQAMWVGFRREVIYYDRAERPYGSSRWTLTKKFKYLIDAFAAFSYLPVRAASGLGFLLAALGFLYALVVVGLRLLRDIPVPGWTSLTVIVLVTSGAQLILVGVLGEYLWRVLDETRHRPPFIVDKTVNLEGE